MVAAITGHDIYHHKNIIPVDAARTETQGGGAAANAVLRSKVKGFSGSLKDIAADMTTKFEPVLRGNPFRGCVGKLHGDNIAR